MSDDAARNGQAIDALVIAYNSHDARAFADLFQPDAVHGNLNAGDGLRGREAIHRRYMEVFSTYPQNRTEVIHRIAYGPFVIDHEKVQRSPGAEPFDVVAIYTMRDGLIDRLDFVRE